MYQRLMDYIFKEMLGWNLEAYVEDMVVKSIMVEEHVTDLADFFATMNEYGLKLNTEKCVFWAKDKTFLRFNANRERDRSKPRKMFGDSVDEKSELFQGGSIVDR